MHGKRNAVIGHDAFASRGCLDFHYPIGEKGKIVDFDFFEDLLSYTAEHALRCDLKGSSVLLCETFNQEKNIREKEIELLFETFGVDSAYVACSSVLALYTTGHTTGVILECGAGRTLVIPVYEGYALSNCVVEHCSAGRDMATLLAKRISEHEVNRKSGVDLNNAYGVYLTESALIEKAMTFAMDESVGTTATKSGRDSKEASVIHKSPSSSIFSLPDGREVLIDDAMIHECREMYFSSENLPLSERQPATNGVVQLVEKCLLGVEHDVRHIGECFILSGGVTGCEGFCERFVADAQPIVSKYVGTRKSLATSCLSWKNGNVKHPCHMAWHGGSILASLQTFGSMWISKSLYEDCGPTIVHRRCL